MWTRVQPVRFRFLATQVGADMHRSTASQSAWQEHGPSAMVQLCGNPGCRAGVRLFDQGLVSIVDDEGHEIERLADKQLAFCHNPACAQIRMRVCPQTAGKRVRYGSHDVLLVSGEEHDPLFKMGKAQPTVSMPPGKARPKIHANARVDSSA